MNLNSAFLSLLIGIPLGTNASMSVESFLQKRISNNPFEQIGNPLQWKHDSKRKVSLVHATQIAIDCIFLACKHCSYVLYNVLM